MNKKETDEAKNQSSSNLSEERFDELFDLVSIGKEDIEQSAPLGPVEREAVEDIQQVLGLVQAARPVTLKDLDTVEAKFLRLLASEEPNHPWLKTVMPDDALANDAIEEESIEVQTLGDIVRLADTEPPEWVSPQVWASFSQNLTPISDLTDTAQRTRLLGPLFKDVGISKVQVPQMYQWFNNQIGSLSPGQNGIFVARRQKKPRRSR